MSRPVCRVPQLPVGRDQLRPAQERILDFAEVVTDASDELARGLAAQCLATVRCEYCEVCQMICPDLCITRDRESGEIRIDLDFCKGCGLCAHFCPKGAIGMVLESPPEDS